MIPINQRRAEPDLCAILDQLADEIATAINCVSIGTILNFYDDTQTADIELNYKRVDLYSGKLSNYQVLIKCPVVVLGGGGGYISFPVDSGDICVVLFCDREIDTWFTNDGIYAPRSARVHDLNDGIALVGIRNSLHPISGYPVDRARWSHGGGYVDLKDGDLFSLPWQSFVSVVTSYSGTITLVAGLGYYRKLGKVIYISLSIAITTIGSAGGYLIATLPIVPDSAVTYIVCGRDSLSGKMLQGVITGGALHIYDYAGSFVGASGSTLTITGTYEAT